MFSDDVAAQEQRQRHPSGWEPGIAWAGDSGTITTAPLEAEPTGGVWAELVADWGLDPAVTEIVPGSIQVRAWDTHDGRRLRYYRAALRAITDLGERADIEALCAAVMRRRPISPATVATGERALLVALSDWQLGKGEGGGTPATVERICSALDQLPARLRELRRSGREVAAVYIVGLGDLVEQCAGHYPGQTFTVDLDRREQLRLARRLILRAVDTVAPLAPRVVLAAVPGNHGENRGAVGKAYTRTTDNDDLAVVEQVAEVLAANPARYGHVATVLAESATLVLEVGGVVTAFAHGHKSGGGGHPAQRIERWWQGQVMGRRPVADASLLLTGHYHHLVISEGTGRTMVQVPAMDGGSEWFTESTGQSSPAGLLTLGVGTAYGPRGWGDLAVLS
jgi:hypothetical protein